MTLQVRSPHVVREDLVTTFGRKAQLNLQQCLDRLRDGQCGDGELDCPLEEGCPNVDRSDGRVQARQHAHLLLRLVNLVEGQQFARSQELRRCAVDELAVGNPGDEFGNQMEERR